MTTPSSLQPPLLSKDAAPLPECTALLPTYNGQAFLREQLASCLAQRGLRILARDDGSRDATVGILNEFHELHGERLEVHQGENLGVKGNVAWLLSRLQTPYFMLADQDDIWEENKFSRLWEAIRLLERRWGTNVPLLAYSDASLVDEAGNQLAPSYFAFARVPFNWGEELRRSLVMSPAPGCTIMGNKALAEAALPFPEEFFMHDWWLLLVAGALGGVHALNEPLVRYRQHGANTLGADGMTWRTILGKCLAGPARVRRNIRLTQRQARGLLIHCGKAMPEEARRLCEAWATMPEKTWPQRVYGGIAHGFAKPGALRNIVFYLCN